MNVLRPAHADAEAPPGTPKPERGVTVQNGIWGAAPSRRYDDLAAPFRPIFRRIQEGATQRERNRVLPFEEIRWLKDAGFGAVHAPKEYGGRGATLPELFALLAELAEADSNLTQALRVHFAFMWRTSSILKIMRDVNDGSGAS
jgi:alkylation response protein AidB-like acyl-CoA dehydrogenase